MQAYHLPCEINDTYDSQTEENNFYGSIIIAKTVWNSALKFNVMELREKWVSCYDVN